MALIIGVLGMLFLICKMSSEKSVSKANKRERAEWKEVRDEWISKITDRDLENEIELYMYENPAEAAKKAKELCPCIPEACPDDGLFNRKIYFRILMSEHGKLRREDAMFGIRKPRYSIGGIPRLIAIQKSRVFYQYIMWLDDNLKQHGADVGELYLERGIGTHFNVQEAEDGKMGGTYIWAPKREAM